MKSKSSQVWPKSDTIKSKSGLKVFSNSDWRHSLLPEVTDVHDMRHQSLFIFAHINFHLYHFSQRSSSALPFNLSIYGTLLFVQIVLAHFRYVQFECFNIPHIIVFVVTQIEYIEFHWPSMLNLCSLHIYSIYSISNWIVWTWTTTPLQKT
jgi:hypothetical protein